MRNKLHALKIKLNNKIGILTLRIVLVRVIYCRHYIVCVQSPRDQYDIEDENRFLVLQIDEMKGNR